MKMRFPYMTELTTEDLLRASRAFVNSVPYQLFRQAQSRVRAVVSARPYLNGAPTFNQVLQASSFLNDLSVPRYQPRTMLMIEEVEPEPEPELNINQLSICDTQEQSESDIVCEQALEYIYGEMNAYWDEIRKYPADKVRAMVIDEVMNSAKPENEESYNLLIEKVVDVVMEQFLQFTQ